MITVLYVWVFIIFFAFYGFWPAVLACIVLWLLRKAWSSEKQRRKDLAERNWRVW